jgi:hypothetical protein
MVIDDFDEVNGTRQGKGLMPMGCVTRFLTKPAYEKRTEVVQQEMSLAGLFKRIDQKDTLQENVKSQPMLGQLALRKK